MDCTCDFDGPLCRAHGPLTSYKIVSPPNIDGHEECRSRLYELERENCSLERLIADLESERRDERNNAYDQGFQDGQRDRGYDNEF